MAQEHAGPMLSPNSGEGESSMSALIQKHLTNILAPVAEHVTELEERVMEHARLLQAAEEKAERASQRLDNHDAKLHGVSSDLSRTSEDLRATKEGLEQACEKHATLENDHDITRSMAVRTDSGHRNTAAALADLQRMHEDLDSRLRQLQLALSETNIAHLNINDRLSELRNRHEGLNDRHLDLVKCVQEAKQADENTRQALKRLTNSYDKQRKEDNRSFGQLDERSKNLEAGLVEQQHKMELATKASRTTKTELSQVRAALDTLMGAHQGFKTQTNQALSERAPNEIQGWMGKMDDVLGRLAQTMASEKQNTHSVVQALSDALAKNSNDIAKSASDIDTMDRQLKSHEARLGKAEQREGELASRQEKLREQADKDSVEMRHLMATFQRDVAGKIDGQSHDLANVKADLHQTSQQLADTVAGVQNLTNELGATNGVVAKVGQRLDLAHEYFQGLSRGLQDTHKRVMAGQDGLLPPKGGGASRKALPVIPGVSSPTPRLG